MKNSLASRIYWYIKYILAKISARKLSRTRLDNLKPNKILVMCYGNIYRSPFVAEYLIEKLGNNSKFEIKSAGFFPKSGRRSAEEYIDIVQDYQIDLSKHLSSVVDGALLNWADAIIIMDGKNFKLSLLLDSEIEEKLIWLSALCQEFPVEIQDPYNKSLDQQRAIVDQMKFSCDSFVDIVKNH